MSDPPAGAPDEPDEEPTAYALRVSARAQRDIEDAVLYLAQAMLGGADGGDVGPAETDADRARRAGVAGKLRAWRDGLDELVTHLSTFPRLYVRSEEFSKRLKREIRQATYRRPGAPNSAAYHVLFSVTDEGDDGPTVTLVHLRHASKRPPTAAEAREILAGQ